MQGGRFVIHPEVTGRQQFIVLRRQQQVLEQAGSIVAVDTVAVLGWFGRDLNTLTYRFDQAVASRTINTRQTHDRRRNTAAQGNIFRRYQGLGGCTAGQGRAVFTDPLTRLLGIDAGTGYL